MDTQFMTLLVFFLFYLSIQFGRSYGAIFLCSDNAGFTPNGTSVWAEIGESASVSFCVDTDNQVHKYIKIQVPYGAETYYTNSTQSRIGVRILNDRTKATINITINPVVQDYFSERFFVRVYRGPGVNNDNLRLWFQLKKKESETVQGKVESTSTTVSTQQSPSSKVGGATPSSGPQCLPRIGSGCPEGWSPVDDHRCLNVINRIPSVYAVDQCTKAGWSLIAPRDIVELKSCLEYLLENSRVKVVRTNGTNYNVPTGEVSMTSDYMVACLVGRIQVQPTITEFYMEPKPPRMRKTVLIRGDYDAIYDVSNGCLRVVCSARGYPVPEVTLLRDNLTLPNSSGGVLTITTPSCLDSGLYACHARNVVNSTQAQRKIQFRSPVKIEPVQIINRTGNTDIRLGDHVTVRCSVTGCPSPYILTLANDANLTLGVFGKSSVIHEISSVQCSDMGAYLCRVETDAQETRADLRVAGCAVQLCRGQNKSATIPRNLNQTTSFSVCLISHEKPTWEKTSGIKNISVTFTQKNGSSIYFTAEISVSKIEENDNETSTVLMKNSYGRLEYHIQLQSDRQTLAASNNHGPTPATEQSSPLPVVLPLVLIVLIVAAIVGVVCYRHKVKRRERKSSSMGKFLNTSDSANDESGQAMYANFREITSGSSSQETTVQEDVIVESCGDNDLASYITGEDSGRFISDEGLVYLTVVEVASKIKKKTQDAKRKPQEVTNNVDDHVEYMTLDFEKTGKFLIPEDTGAGQTGEQTRQENARDAQPRTNDSKE